MNAALAVIALFFATAIMLGLLARRGRKMTLEQWSVGGRGFGSIFVFLLMAGEIYTTFTFLGGSGWAYGRGAPAFYILCYGAIAYSISYFLLPVIWTYAKKHDLLSQADFFVKKYDSKGLGVFVALVSVVAIVPYLVLQLKGLGIIVSEASYGSISPSTAIWMGTLAVTVFVVVSGVHGSAWTAALKDVMILAIAVFLGVYLPLHYYGGFGAMFTAIDQAKPGFLTLPAQGMSVSWFISTVLLTALGFYMWPHAFGSVYTARDASVFRKNAIVLPLYQLVLLFVFFAGFAAVLQIKGLTGADADLSLLRISKLTFDPWLVGLIGAAGVLTALVPGSMLLMTASTIIAQNIYRVVSPGADSRRVSLVARLCVPVIAGLSLALTLQGGTEIVQLLLLGYGFVTQLFPALILSLGERPFATRAGAIAGIAVGELMVTYLGVSKTTLATLMPWAPSVIRDLNIGLAALAVNFAVVLLVSSLTKGRSRVGVAA
jgi:solute:Na+ symporter, SSS family